MKCVILLLVGAATCLLPANAQTINGRRAGDPAPPLTLAKWLAGEPVVAFEPGRYYLVEFTHRQCKACVEGIPTLTRLAERYAAQLTVISIYSYWPNDKQTEEQYEAAIRKLMAEMGGRMRFHIAMDNRSRTSHTAWYGPEPSGFPFLFLVDKQGKLAWWGAGGSALDNIVRALPAIMSGEASAFQAKIREDEYLRVRREIRTRDGATALGRIDSLMAAYPEKYPHVAQLKFATLLRVDEAQANVYLAATLNTHPDFSFDPEAYFNPGKHPDLDWRLGLELYDRQARTAVTDAGKAHVLMLKSKHYAMHGHYPEAKITIERAIDLRAGPAADSTAVPADYREFHQAYSWQVWRSTEEAAAKRWLEAVIQSGTLGKITAAWLASRFNDGLTPHEIEQLKAYTQRGRSR